MCAVNLSTRSSAPALPLPNRRSNRLHSFTLSRRPRRHRTDTTLSAADCDRQSGDSGQIHIRVTNALHSDGGILARGFFRTQTQKAPLFSGGLFKR
jgi:hypothetical protein